MATRGKSIKITLESLDDCEKERSTKNNIEELKSRGPTHSFSYRVLLDIANLFTASLSTDFVQMKNTA